MFDDDDDDDDYDEKNGFDEEEKFGAEKRVRAFLPSKHSSTLRKTPRRRRKTEERLTVLGVHGVLHSQDVQRQRRAVDREQEGLGPGVDADARRGRGRDVSRGLVGADVGELAAGLPAGAAW